MKTRRQPRKVRPVRSLLASLRSDGALTATTLVSLWLFNAVALILQALVLRATLSIGSRLADRGQMIGAMGALLGLLFLLLIARFASASGIFRYARLIEMKFRCAVLRKVPRLGDRYFQTRLPADVAERSQSITTVRSFPFAASRIISCAFEIALTTAALIWLEPALWYMALSLAAISVAVPFAASRATAASELRVRVHTATLGHHLFDALSGAPVIRAHGAEPAVRATQQELIAAWAQASRQLNVRNVASAAAQMSGSLAVAALMVFHALHRSTHSGNALLLVYWSFHLPFLANTLWDSVYRYSQRRNATLRLLELIQAPEERIADVGEDGSAPTSGVAIAMAGVDVAFSGHRVLSRISLNIAAGEHVAILGASGAGKSSLMGVLLGWSPVVAGEVQIDGKQSHAELQHLRRTIAWIDPSVRLWNKTLIENLIYGADVSEASHVEKLIEEADLLALIASLPQAYQTVVGEGGTLVSGGEGQRIRLARAMSRSRSRLVLLDEPFRGLGRQHRGSLLRRARVYWKDATLLCATHDVAQTRDFDRVIILEGGEVVECGIPSDLMSIPSIYRELLERDCVARKSFDPARGWRRIHVRAGGQVDED